MASDTSATTVYSENTEQPIKWYKVFPLQVKRDVPSGMTPLPWVLRILPQRFVFGDLQNLHSRHCGMYNGTTWSPVKKKKIIKYFNAKYNSLDDVWYILTRFEFGDIGTNAFDYSSTLVSQDTWKKSFRIQSIEGVSIGMTQCNRDNFYSNFVSFRRCNVYHFQGQRLFCLPSYSGTALDYLKNIK